MHPLSLFPLTCLNLPLLTCSKATARTSWECAVRLLSKLTTTTSSKSPSAVLPSWPIVSTAVSWSLASPWSDASRKTFFSLEISRCWRLSATWAPGLTTYWTTLLEIPKTRESVSASGCEDRVHINTGKRMKKGRGKTDNGEWFRRKWMSSSSF